MKKKNNSSSNNSIRSTKNYGNIISAQAGNILHMKQVHRLKEFLRVDSQFARVTMDWKYFVYPNANTLSAKTSDPLWSLHFTQFSARYFTCTIVKDKKKFSNCIFCTWSLCRWVCIMCFFFFRIYISEPEQFTFPGCVETLNWSPLLRCEY